MKKLLTYIKFAILILSVGGSIIAGFIVFNPVFFNSSFKIDASLASNFGSFFGGFVGTIFTMVSMLLIVYTLISQNVETAKTGVKDRFFKMLDFHNENVRHLKIPSLDNKKKNIVEEGRRVFVVYKIQLKYIIKIVSRINAKKQLNLTKIEIADISYICFYYGMDMQWRSFVVDKLKIYDRHHLIISEILSAFEAKKDFKLCRPNHTELSAYFRNIYNAIKMVDEESNLSDNEKLAMVKILRAQLSNPELYVLFFNLITRFGLRWHENNYIIKYKLIKNLPKDYCDGYDPKKYFNICYEYENQSSVRDDFSKFYDIT